MSNSELTRDWDDGLFESETFPGSGDASETGIRRGMRFGNCVLQTLIGHGSMGAVWKAWHTTLGIAVAVKILREADHPAENILNRERFALEARLAARVRSENLVRVLDFGEEHGRQFLVMELVEGTTLEGWLGRKVEFDERAALKVAGHICIGLAGLHHAGVVHRDIKPANILVESGRSIKISDLGLAYDTASNLSTDIAGTPYFMAPECLDASNACDPRSDLYAVGVVLYRLIMHRLPFTGSTPEVLMAHRERQPDWTLPEGARVDSGTLYMIRRLLEKDPTRRIQTALEAIQACRDQIHRLDMRERLRQEQAARPAATSDAPVLETGRTPLAPRKWMGIEAVFRSIAVPDWVRWAGLAVILLAGAYCASCVAR